MACRAIQAASCDGSRRGHGPLTGFAIVRSVPNVVDLRDDYLDLVEKALLAVTNGPMEVFRPASTQTPASPLRRAIIQRWLVKRGHAVLVYKMTIDPAEDPEGARFVTALPPGMMTMVGRTRLHHARTCVEQALADGIPGDFIETGVWRGGTTIMMRAVLKAYGVTDRRVYVADSFEGLPPPNPELYPADRDLFLNVHTALAVGLEDVRAKFRTLRVTR